MARLFSSIRGWMAQGQRACFFRSLRRAWDQWGFYVSLALVLALIGYGTVAIRNRPVREASPVVAMQPALISPTPTATAVPTLLFQWPLSGEILMAHSPESAIYQSALGAFTAHEGIDIASWAGETVCAAADGTIVAFYASSAYGYVLDIEHMGGFVTRYGGLSATSLVQSGERVRAGQDVGTVGDVPCGESHLGPHLHFEILDSGLSVGPEAFLAGRTDELVYFGDR